MNAARAVIAASALAVFGVVVRLRADAPRDLAQKPATFERVVQPILLDTCAECHNDREPTAGLSISHLTQPKSLETERDGWERILDKLRAGEMPPPFGPPVPAERDRSAGRLRSAGVRSR